jgi:hypothetical protein
MRDVPKFFLALVCLALPLAAVGGPVRASDTNSLAWRVKENQVDAQIQKWDLPRLLKNIASATGWRVYVEPGTSNEVSAKFKNLAQDDALRRLLGKLNYFRDETNGVSRLFVFQTASKAATEMVKVKKDYRIANELLVKLKHNQTNGIDGLAKKLGAIIVGRDDKIGFYRLQFPDGTTADAAMPALASDSSVAAVDSNYLVDPPTPVQMTATGPAPSAPLFNLNPPDVSGPIVGLVDTAVDPPDQFSKYMLPPVSVVGTPDPPTDQPSHGTAMLETVLGAMAADPSMVQPVVVYSSTQSTTTYDLMNGVIQAINLGDNPISISSGGTGNSVMFGDLIQQAEAKGIEIVAAAGNTPGTEDEYPAAYPGVLAVTASAPNGQLASYADDGSFVKAIEPGTVPVVYDGQEWLVSGTSPATATMSGSITALENQTHVSAQQAAAELILIHPAPH